MNVDKDKSEHVGDLFAALAKAQGEMSSAAKDAKNPHTRSSYASLASVTDAVRGPLAGHGLSITQWPRLEEGSVSVVTVLGHASGQWMRSTISAPIDQQRNKVQAVGSTITYLRRYALMAVCGIAPDDDDGHAGGGQTDPQTRRKEAPDEKAARQAGHDPSWASDRARFCAALGEHLPWLTYEDLAAWCESRGKLRPSKMTQVDRSALWGWMTDKGGAEKVRAWLTEQAAKGGV